MRQSILALAFFRYPRLIKFSVIYDKVIKNNNFVYAGFVQNLVPIWSFAIQHGRDLDCEKQWERGWGSSEYQPRCCLVAECATLPKHSYFLTIEECRRKQRLAH